MLNHFRLHGHNPKLSINVITKNCRVCSRIVKMAAPFRVHSFFFPSAYIPNPRYDSKCEYTVCPPIEQKHATSAIIWPHSWWKSINCNRNQLKIFKRPLPLIWQTFMVDHYFCPILIRVLISPIVPKAVRPICVNRIHHGPVAVCTFLS